MKKRKTDVLIVGEGGREHAIAWKLAESPGIGRICVAPGNGGIQGIAENVPINATDIGGLLRFALAHNIGLTVVGPDAPLALGIVDAFRRRGLRIFGPTRAAAQIEGSKVFAKELMQRAGIPTGAFRAFQEHDKALAYVRKHGAPLVIKASGLALGKGVHVCFTVAEAEIALTQIMLERVHGNAGDEVVAEEFLDGPEISVHVLSDGTTHRVLPPSQDHKPVYDGDKGPNTGGMGTIAPVPWVSAGVMRGIGKKIIRPVLGALADQGTPFTGLLYPGLKMTKQGPKVVEYNARWGDPEAQVYMRRLKTPLLDVLIACVDGTLDQLTVEWHPGFAVCVVLAAAGYPRTYKRGLRIFGISEAERVPDVIVFHAGTCLDDDGQSGFPVGEYSVCPQWVRRSAKRLTVPIQRLISSLFKGRRKISCIVGVISVPRLWSGHVSLSLRRTNLSGGWCAVFLENTLYYST